MTQNQEGKTGSWAEDRVRTGDPDLGKVVLYQLSYFRLKTSFHAHRGCGFDWT